MPSPHTTEALSLPRPHPQPLHLPSQIVIRMSSQDLPLQILFIGKGFEKERSAILKKGRFDASLPRIHKIWR
jgi:hypothetical protein